MATHDYVIANGTGAAVRSDLNNALAAIVSNNSSSSEPSTTYAYQWWADTNNNVLKIRNSANNAWITLRELDGTMLIEDGSAASPGLAFADDTNTGLFSPAADNIAFTTGGGERLRINNTETVFNEDSNSYDFRVESNGLTHALFVDGSADAVGIGTSSPDTSLDVNNASANCTIRARTATGFSSFLSLLPNGSGTGVALAANSDSSAQLFNQLNSHLAFGTNNAEQARIDSSGRLLVGLTSARATKASGSIPSFQIEGTGDSDSRMNIGRNSNTDNGPEIHLYKTRGTTLGSNTVVQDGDFLGTIAFFGADGNDLFSRGADITAAVDGTPGSDDMPTRLSFATCADGAASATERMRITSAGATIFSTAPDTTFGRSRGGNPGILCNSSSASNTAGLEFATDSTSTRHCVAFTIASTAVGGITTSGSSTAYVTSSDYRLKENIVDITDGITRVKQLSPKRFNFISDESKTVDGFLAHEAQTVVPEAVTGTHNEVQVWDESENLPDGVSAGDNKLDEDGNTIPQYQGIDQSKLVPLLTAALQEAIAKIETLETKVAALEAG